jgi:hypothetical protein
MKHFDAFMVEFAAKNSAALSTSGQDQTPQPAHETVMELTLRLWNQHDTNALYLEGRL